MLKLEGFIVVNLLLFLFLFTFVVESIARHVAVTLLVLVEKYFDAKKEFLINLSKLEVPSIEDDVAKRKFN